MGGNKTLATNLPSNGLLLCDGPTVPDGGCHRWVEANRVEAIELGLLVRQGVERGENKLVKRISKWLERGHIQTHGIVAEAGGDRPLYRLRDILDLLDLEIDPSRAG